MKPLPPKEAVLWLRILNQWVPRGMGNTGPTLPFLIGASRLNSPAAGRPDISDMSRLLAALHNSTTHYIKIEECGTLHQPVAAEYSRTYVMSAEELVRKPSGTGSLHISKQYQHSGDLEAACASLWAITEDALSQQHYSYHVDRYGTFTPRDLSFIRGLS